MNIDRIDHLVLTVADLDATLRFYTEVLGMQEITFGAGRKALRFGESKINLHQRGREFEPKAHRPTPGSADLCFVVEECVDSIAAELASAGTINIDGPVERSGASGPIRSIYLRDPDGNLLELSNYLDAPGGPNTD